MPPSPPSRPARFVLEFRLVCVTVLTVGGTVSPPRAEWVLLLVVGDTWACVRVVDRSWWRFLEAGTRTRSGAEADKNLKSVPVGTLWYPFGNPSSQG